MENKELQEILDSHKWIKVKQYHKPVSSPATPSALRTR
jgi:hypothetical protein